MPLRVALVIERIEPWRGGAETSTVQLAHRLTERGCRVSIVTRSDVHPTADYEVLTIPGGRGWRWQQTARFIRNAADATAGSAFDIVHAITLCPTADVYQPRGGSIRETVARNVAMRHRPIDRAFKRLTNAFSFRQQMLLRLETELLERDSPPMVAAVSQYVADQMRQHHGLDTDHVEVLFNGVEAVQTPSDGRERLRLMLQDRHDLPAGSAIALFVAHNFKLKGLARLIEALPRVLGKAHVLVVGRDRPRRFQAQAARLGVADRLDFVGAVPNMAEYYGGVDFCIHPTYYDPCSRVVLEALSAGLPVVTTRHNGAAEVMEDGVHGFVIDSADDVPALAVAMNRLLDAERRTLMGECAQRLRQRVSMARHAEELVALYERVLRRKGTR